MKSRKCVIEPEITFNPDLKKLECRCLYIALMQSCEDSGCFLLDIPSTRKRTFPFQDEITNDDVAAWVEEIVAADLVWLYEIDGVRCGYIPDFAVWNSSLNRWNAPQQVPLPAGIVFTKHEGSTRFNTGTYSRPITKAQLNPTSEVIMVGTPTGGLPATGSPSVAVVSEIKEALQFNTRNDDTVF